MDANARVVSLFYYCYSFARLARLCIFVVSCVSLSLFSILFCFQFISSYVFVYFSNVCLDDDIVSSIHRFYRCAFGLKMCLHMYSTCRHHHILSVFLPTLFETFGAVYLESVFFLSCIFKYGSRKIFPSDSRMKKKNRNRLSVCYRATLCERHTDKEHYGGGDGNKDKSNKNFWEKILLDSNID